MSKRSKILLLTLFLMGSSFLIERIIGYQKFSLYHLNDEFIVEKKLTEMGLVSSDAFYLTRSSLSQGKLHLNRWQGHQAVSSLDHKAFKYIQLDGYLGFESEITIYWGKSESGFEGIKIDKNRDVHYFLADELGAFIKKKSLNYKLLEHKFDIRINQSGTMAFISINDTKLSPLEITRRSGRWGVRGGVHPIYVDSIFTIDENDKIHSQNFSPPFNFLAFLIPFCVLGISWYCFNKAQFQFESLFNNAYYLMVLLAFVLGVDYFYWSHLPIDYYSINIHRPNNTSFNEKLEKLRLSIFDADWDSKKRRKIIDASYPIYRIWKGPILCHRDSGCATQHTSQVFNASEFEKTKRLMLVGTSQSVGAGASKLGKTFFAHLHYSLNTEKPYTSLNISISGVDAEQLFQEFQLQSAEFKPHTILINLGFNGPIHNFKEVLTKYIQQGKSLKADIFVIKEANNNNFRNHYLDELEEVTLKERVPLISVHEYLSKEKSADRGELWWDVVHLTDRGHELFSTYILESMLKQSVAK